MYCRAFTLIELLIVVAIIAILAAIAVPNFLEAQTRAKVSRAKADMNAVGTALETYQIDNNAYPYQNTNSLALRSPTMTTKALEVLTTPIAYMTSMSFADPFRSTGAYSGPSMDVFTPYTDPVDLPYQQLYRYMARNEDGDAWQRTVDAKPKWWMTESAGPAGKATATRTGLNSMRADTPANQTKALMLLYDPTNGTVSRGNIWRVGGTPVGPGAIFYKYVMAHQG